MGDLLIPLMQEYQRLVAIEAEFDKWRNENPDVYGWNYNGKRVSRARFERIGIMIRQTMIDYEKSRKR